MRRLILFLALLLLLPGPALAERTGGDEPVITVTLLGTGAPPPLADRFGPATLVQAGGQALLFDAVGDRRSDFGSWVCPVRP